MLLNQTQTFVSNKVNHNFLAKKFILDELQIVIPTQDGKRISTFFRSSPFYKVLKVKNGKVKALRVVKNALNSGKTDTAPPLNADSCNCKNLSDCFCNCQVLIIKRIDHKSWDELGHMGVEIIQTDENEIDRSVQKYLEGMLQDKFNLP